MNRVLLLLALLLTACGAPATETPAPVPTVPANWCRVTALSFVAFYATTDVSSARQGEVAPASDFHVRPASVQFANAAIWGYAVSHWAGEYAEGWHIVSPFGEAAQSAGFGPQPPPQARAVAGQGRVTASHRR